MASWRCSNCYAKHASATKLCIHLLERHIEMEPLEQPQEQLAVTATERASVKDSKGFQCPFRRRMHQPQYNDKGHLKRHYFDREYLVIYRTKSSRFVQSPRYQRHQVRNSMIQVQGSVALILSYPLPSNRTSASDQHCSLACPDLSHPKG